MGQVKKMQLNAEELLDELATDGKEHDAQYCQHQLLYWIDGMTLWDARNLYDCWYASRNGVESKRDEVL